MLQRSELRRIVNETLEELSKNAKKPFKEQEQTHDADAGALQTCDRTDFNETVDRFPDAKDDFTWCSHL